MADATALYTGFIKAASRRYGIPEPVIERVIKAESGGNPHARSPVGALGLMQLMPATARGLGVDNPLDPQQNIMGGTKYLRDQLNHFGNLRSALAAYNAGPGAVTKYGGVPPYLETQHYVNEILGGGMGIPNVGAAPQESQPALAASAGSGDSAPTRQGPNLMQLANNLLQNEPIPSTPGFDQPKMASDLGAVDWRQFMPQKANGKGQLPAAQDIPGLQMLGERGVGPRLLAPVSGSGSAIVHAAHSYLGVPYKWGGTSRQGGMDCSGFLQNVMKNVGIKIGRTTYEQIKEGQAVGLKDLQPGDAVFTEPGHAGPNHVGLYIGHGMVQESPHTGTVNSIIPLKNYLGGGFVGARRYTHMLPMPKPKK